MKESAKTISELVAGAVVIATDEGWDLEQWENGMYFVRSPDGEGTQVDAREVREAFKRLFREHF